MYGIESKKKKIKVNVPISAPVHNSAPLYSYLFSIVKKKIRIFFIEKIENTFTTHQP